MKKLSLFLLLFLGGCYTQFTVVEPQKREVVVVRNGYYTPHSPIYPYSLYRWEYYSRYYPYERYYLTTEYKWRYIHPTPPKPTTPQTRRSSGVQPPQRTESGRRGEVNGGSRRDGENVRRGSEGAERTKRPERRVEVNRGSRRDGENVRRGSEGAERTKRPERRVEVTEGGKRENGNVRRGSVEVERTKRPERRVE